MTAVWPSTVVTDDSLVQCITELRQVLGEKGRRLIRTIPRRGYVFEAKVRQCAKSPVDDQLPADSGSGTAAPLVEVSLRTGSAGAGVIELHGIGGAGPCCEEVERRPLTVAIRPLTVIGETSTDALGLGMADAIIVRLSLEKQIEVTPTTAVSRYDGSAVTSQSIARELGVESVMEGSVQRDDGRVRVVARLLRGADGATLWTGTFEQAFHDIFAMQDSITEQIASALLNRAIDFSPIRLERKETGEPDAYEAYLTGLHFMARRTEDGLRRAIELFSKAIAVDSRYARAYSGLAQSYDLIGAYSAYPPHEAFSNAIAASSMAIALDPSLAEAYAALAFAKAHRDYDWIAAEGGYQRAIDLAPGYATARQWRALALAAQGHAREAIEECLRALKSDPVSLIINTDLARHYYYSGRMEDAANRLRRTIDLDPSFMRAHYELGRVYKQREMYDLALTELDRAMQLSNRSPIVLAEIGAVHALVGHREEAFAARRELEDRTAGGHVSQYHVAVLLSALGDHNATINALAAAHEERFNWIVFINVEPNFRQLKSLPSFRALVQRLRLDSTS